MAVAAPTQTPAATVPTVVAHEAPSGAEREALEAEGHEEDRSYGKAVLLGSAAGIVVWTAVVFAVLRLISGDDMVVGASLGIAVWVGIWTGLFLGGTITVGLWADKRH